MQLNYDFFIYFFCSSTLLINHILCSGCVGLELAVLQSELDK